MHFSLHSGGRRGDEHEADDTYKATTPEVLQCC